jgi:hypothetical protein
MMSDDEWRTLLDIKRNFRAFNLSSLPLVKREMISANSDVFALLDADCIKKLFSKRKTHFASPPSSGVKLNW